jgi:serine/threonine protein kinase
VDATKRYTADQALAHPWVTGQRTPNQFLKSPNYLRTIKKERLLAQKTGAASPYDPERESNGQPGRTIANRRQSH